MTPADWIILGIALLALGMAMRPRSTPTKIGGQNGPPTPRPSPPPPPPQAIGLGRCPACGVNLAQRAGKWRKLPHCPSCGVPRQGGEQ